MIRLLTEIEDECVKPETVLVAYERMEQLLNVMDEEDTVDLLEDAETECFWLASYLRYIDEEYFENMAEKFHKMSLYSMTDLVIEPDPDYDYAENLARLRKDCIRYLAIWHPHPMLTDYNRAYINYSLRESGYTDFALIGDAYDPKMRMPDGTTKPSYNAAWYRAGDNTVIMSMSQNDDNGETRTTVIPFSYVQPDSSYLRKRTPLS